MNIINFAFTKTVYLLRKPNVVRKLRYSNLNGKNGVKKN